MKHLKTLAVTVAVIMAFSIIMSGCGEAENAGESVGSTSASTAQPETGEQTVNGAQDPSLGGLELPVTTEEIKYTWMLEQHPTWPVNQDWANIKKIQELTGVQIEFQPIPAANYIDKKNIMIASRDFPDIMSVELQDTKNYGKDGAFLELGKLIEQNAPNIRSVFEKLPQMKTDAVDSTGNLYGFPQYDLTYEQPIIGWFYRKDIFDANGLKSPTTDDEFYQVLKALKEKYPKNYPLTFRGLEDGAVMDKFIYSYGLPASPVTYYEDTGKVEFIPSLPIYKQMVEYVSKLYKDGLMDASYMTVTRADWEQRLLKGDAFVTNDWESRVAQFNQSNATAEKPIQGYAMDIMKPWVPENGKGWVQTNPIVKAASNVLNPKIKNPEVAVKFFDFLYSPMGVELLYWGVEGDTFKRNPDGGRELLPKVQTAYNTGSEAKPGAIYGLGYNNLAHYFISNEKDRSDLEPNMDLYFKYIKENKLSAPPPIVYNFTDEENDVWKSKFPAVEKYFKQNIDKFVIGLRPLSEWDQFIKEFDKFEIEKLVELKQKVYDRQFGAGK